MQRPSAKITDTPMSSSRYEERFRISLSVLFSFRVRTTGNHTCEPRCATRIVLCPGSNISFAFQLLGATAFLHPLKSRRSEGLCLSSRCTDRHRSGSLHGYSCASRSWSLSRAHRLYHLARQRQGRHSRFGKGFSESANRRRRHRSGLAKDTYALQARTCFPECWGRCLASALAPAARLGRR